MAAETPVKDRRLVEAVKAGDAATASALLQKRVDVNVADLPEVTAPKVHVLREMELVSVTPAIVAERRLRNGAGALIYRTFGSHVAEYV